MIDNFAPQPYPLECSAEEGSWMLVLGWQRSPTGDLTPVVARPGGAAGPVTGFVETLQYRPADTRPIVAPRATASPAVAPRREARS